MTPQSARVPSAPPERPDPPASDTVTLRSHELEIVLLPSKGADIYSIIDRASGIDVLFKTPWGWRDPRLLPSAADSQLDWLTRATPAAGNSSCPTPEWLVSSTP